MENTNIQVSPYIIFSKNHKINKWNLQNYLLDEEYSIDEDTIAIIMYCKNNVNINKLYAKFGHDIINHLIEKEILMDSSEVWKKTNIKHLEIEINTHCNRRCIYCPVSIDPKKAEYMDMKLYENIIRKAEKYEKIKTISFNHYNEPTIDKYIIERLEMLAKTNIKLELNTNASFLNQNIIELLQKTNILHELWINLPSLNEENYKQMTGVNSFYRDINNIENAIKAGLPVKFSVNGNNIEIKENLPLIKERYEPLIETKITAWGTHDRAGNLTNKYFKNYNVENPKLFAACSSLLDTIHIGVNGECYICYNDYYKKEVYGNIANEEIDDVLLSEQAITLRKYAYGGEIAPEKFLCRKCNQMRKSQVLNNYFIKAYK